jgi:LemA protein
LGQYSGIALLRERSQNINNSQDMDRYMAAEHVSIAELSARIEEYPDLKGTDLVADFHRRLLKLEIEVALIRSGFNDAVTQYLIRLQTFPDNLVARLFRFKPRTRLVFSEAAHQIPRVLPAD